MRRLAPDRRLAPAVLLVGILCALCALTARGQVPTEDLLRQASSLESRGRSDLAALTWQQVLLVDPANAEAAAGLRRAAKQAGHRQGTAGSPGRVRAGKVDERDLPQGQDAGAQEGSSAELERAVRFASVGQYAQAMGVYRAVFGATPPPGDLAVAYYETEGATEGGRAHAIAGLRGLAERSPGDARYAIALARLLTYDARTRAGGRRVLQRYPRNVKAVEALRQSLVWDAASPSVAPDLRAYLALHPDPQLAELLKEQPSVKRAALERHATVSIKPRTNEEEAAYRDLNAGDIGRAEMLFRVLLERHPGSGPALAGMGYVRMQQGNFGAAISFLTQALQAGIDDATLQTELDAARFWYTMGEGLGAMAQNDWAAAEKQYQAALGLRPRSPEALDGLGRALLQGRHPDRAAAVYARLAEAQPTSVAAWRGLVQAQAAAGNVTAAVATDRTMPVAVREELMRDPGYVGGAAAAYAAAGETVEAKRMLDAGLDLPFPPGGRGLDAEASMGYASLLLQAGHLEQAAGLYRQTLAADAGNAAGWEGLVSVLHVAHRDADAQQTIEGMPPGTYAAVIRDPGFDGTVAEVFAAQGKLDVAQSVLEQGIARLKGAGETVPPELQVALAGIHMRRGAPEVAYAMDQQVLAEHAERVDAWKGLVAALHASGRDRDALLQIRQIAPTPRLRLESDPDYLQTVAEVYRSLGDPAEASVFLTRILQIDVLDQVTPAADLELEEARLLLQAGNDASLYAALRTLNARRDLGGVQRAAVEAIWATWAVNRSRQAAAQGDTGRATALLDGAASAFPQNRAVLRLVAGGYCRAGEPERAVGLYRRIGLIGPTGPTDSTGLQGSTAGEYETAVTAALGAGETRQATRWLREGRAAYPEDAQLLLLAAGVERVGGSAKRAAELYRSALAVMPVEIVGVGAEGDGSGSSDEPISPGELGALLAPASGSVVAQYPPLPPLVPGSAMAATPQEERQSTPSGGTSPRLRDYIPLASVRSRVTLRASTAAPQVRQVAIQRGSDGQNPLVEAVARGSSGTMTLERTTEVQAQSDGARTGQSHPPGDDLPVVVSGGAGAATASSAQIPQPAKPPGETHGQQYPQPRRTAPRRRPSIGSAGRGLPQQPPAAPPVSATAGVRSATPPVPQRPEIAVSRFPGMSYPIPEEAAVAGSAVRSREEGADQPPVPGIGRREAEAQLAALEASYSGTATARGVVRSRAGTPGVDRLTDLETSVEMSAVVAQNVRAAVIARGVFLNSGTFRDVGAGAASALVVGTLPAGAALSPPLANGLGGEVQVVTANYGLGVGYTPYEFPVHTLTARVRVRPAGGPVTLEGAREPVRQTQLSYAGLRDPGAPGNIWGGVVATGGGVRVEFGDARAAYTVLAHGASLTGRHVLDNTSFDAAVAADFRLHSWRRAGTLRLGGALDGAHSAHNERGLSFGQGGYFSPNYAVRAAVPASFQGHAGRAFQYRVSAAGGFQTYQERAALFYPLDAGLQAAASAACGPAAQGCAMYPLRGAISGHYAVDVDGVYRLGEHWSLGGFVAANNTRFYRDVSTGFSFRYLLTPQVEVEGVTPGLIPRDGLVPLRVP